MSSNTEELRIQARTYASKIHTHNLWTKPHYSVAHNGLIHKYNKGGSTDEVYRNNEQYINNVQNGEVFGHMSINTQSQDEAIELVRLLQLYSTSKNAPTNAITQSSSSPTQAPAPAAASTDDDVVVVKNNKKRKAVTELSNEVGDEEDVSSSAPYIVRCYAHKARNAKALLLVATRDSKELNLGAVVIRKAKDEYEDAMKLLRIAHHQAIVDKKPAASDEEDVESLDE